MLVLVYGSIFELGCFCLMLCLLSESRCHLAQPKKEVLLFQPNPTVT